MNYNDYVFLLYIDQFYDHQIFTRLLGQAQKGMSLVQRKRARQAIKDVPKPKRVKGVLLIYIIFNRTREHSHIDELGNTLFEEMNNTSQKRLMKCYKELEEINEALGLPELEVTKQVVKNAHKFTK